MQPRHLSWKPTRQYGVLIENTTGRAQGEKHWLSNTRKTKMVQSLHWFLSQCQIQTCSWDIWPRFPQHSIVFALDILQNVPRVIKWTQAWPWHATLCDHNEAAILAHSHTIWEAQSLYQDLCLLAYWVIHQESAGVLHLQPWKKELPAFTFIIGENFFSRKGTRPLANFKIVDVLHRIITYYLSTYESGLLVLSINNTCKNATTNRTHAIHIRYGSMEPLLQNLTQGQEIQWRIFLCNGRAF